MMSEISETQTPLEITTDSNDNSWTVCPFPSMGKVFGNCALRANV